MDEATNDTAAALKIATYTKMELSAESAENQNTANENESTNLNNSKKDSSLEEDILGANSLLMSETDDENDNKGKGVKDVIVACQDQRTDFNAGEEQNKNITNVNDDDAQIKKTEVICNNNLPMKRKKISAILDSDTDDDNNETKTETQMSESHKLATGILDSDTDDTNVGTKLERQKSVGKRIALIDSDTDNEVNEIKIKTQNSLKTHTKSKVSALIDTDSETDQEKNSKNTNKLKVYDFNEEDSDNKKTKRLKKIKKLKKKKDKQKSTKTRLEDTDSDNTSRTSNGSESNESINDEELENLSEADVRNNVEYTENVNSKPMRASAKKALDEMQAIQSEQQRLHREAHINIPYHKPKRHTLQEFLKRRTIVKPALDNECSPAAAIIRQKSLKMTAEELEEYAKLMEERANEAKEFFKSESDSESEKEFKDNDGVLDMETTIELDTNVPKTTTTIVDISQNKIQTTETTTLNEFSNEKQPENSDTHMEDAKQEIQMNSNSMVDNSIEINKVTLTEITECSTQPIITEVLELPRLDLSTLHVTEDQHDNIDFTSFTTNDNKVNEDQKMRILDELYLTESPRLKGDENMLIDLESGDLIEKKSSGADNLLQRLLATHKAKKEKTDETVNILSCENGKLEMTKVNFHHHHDDMEANKEQKPGAAYIKLKENLKNLIKKKRLEEMQKKQEDEDEYDKCLEGDDDDDSELDEEYEIENNVKDKKKKLKPKSEEIIIDDEENAVLISDNEVEDDTEEEDSKSMEQDVDADNEKCKEIEKEKDNTNVEECEENEIEELKSDTESDSNNSDDDDDDTDNNENDHKFKEPIATTQRKNRIIKAFATDSDADDDDIDLLKTQLPIPASNVVTPLFGNINSPMKSSLSLGTSSTAEDMGNTQELLELCSGAFDTTQKSKTTATTTTTDENDSVLISQILMTLRNSEIDSTNELLALCSGNFEQQQMVTETQQLQSTESKQEEEEITQPKIYKILSSDEEENEDGEGKKKLTKNRLKKLRKKLRKGQAKLGFSDDEDELEENDFDVNENNENDDDINENDDLPETYIEYDSEENEIIVEMTKKDRKLRAENFVEHEAELSESEWGSADEDEKNMDNYDIELGDEDEFDREKLQQELGQIHARKVLDEDIREVRKIQEMLFEDEENDGIGRQRQFRWKNAESGFSLDDMQRGGEDGINGNESGDEEQRQEHEWRKIRFEREQLLKEQGIKESSQEFVTTTPGGTVSSPLATLVTNIKSVNKNITPIIKSNGKKIQIITKKGTNTTTTTTKQKGSPFLISTMKKAITTSIETTTNLTPKSLTSFNTPPATSTILQPKSVRGSFLMRDKETLTKFANITKGISTTSNFETNETAGSVSVKTIKAKNFVFATLTKEEHEHMKRKADDLINSSSENGINFMKKPRTTEPTEKHCFIDKLL